MRRRVERTEVDLASVERHGDGAVARVGGLRTSLNGDVLHPVESLGVEQRLRHE